MANSATELSNLNIQTPTSERPFSMITTATPAALSSTKLLSDAAGFDRPLSPRKRRRSSKPSLSSTNRETRTSTAASLSDKAAVHPEFRPPYLTGAAAIADEQMAKEKEAQHQARQISPNPARKVIGSLLAAQINPMSSAHDAPSAPKDSHQFLTEVAPSIKIAHGPNDEADMRMSPRSLSGSRTIDNAPQTAITANSASLASPGQMEDGVGEDGPSSRRDSEEHTQDEAYPDDGRKAFSYPGHLMGQAPRTSSLPQSGYGGRDSTRSPSSKRHKCPYCNTDFTRHHNLKSHLLTHSQEKPYSCDACDSRFRRLHDLKRHTKLHTGERPHVCPKCDRSFARGDALARHNKGQGGCAGRRSSMGSFGGDDRHEDRMRAGEGDSMPGIIYTGQASHEPEHMDEGPESPGGKSFPSIRKYEAPPPASNGQHRQTTEQASMYQSRQPSTYPPVAARPPTTGSLYPPPPLASPRAPAVSSTAQPSLNQNVSGPGAPSYFQASGPNVFAQGGMTESPRPLSPGGMHSHQLGQADTGIRRNRSPSLTQQFQQQHFGRRHTGNTTSPSMNLPPPHSNKANSNAPQLPPLQGLSNLTPPDSRYTLHSQAGGSAHGQSNATSNLAGPAHGSHSPSYPPGNISSANNSLSSHSTGPHGSLDRIHDNYAQPNDRLWAIVHSLESKVNRLENDVVTLKGQLNAPPQPR